jgi:hypothetical protein
LSAHARALKAHSRFLEAYCVDGGNSGAVKAYCVDVSLILLPSKDTFGAVKANLESRRITVRRWGLHRIVL